MANRWTDGEKEDLYLISMNCVEEINRHRTLEPSSEIIQQIHRSFANSSRDTRSILYQLAEMGFLKTGKDTHQIGRFFVNRLNRSDFLSFKVAPKYKKLTLLQSSAFNSCYEQEISKTSDVEKLCTAMSRLLGLSSIRIKKELLERKLIQLNLLMNYELVSPLITKEKDEYLKMKALSSEHQERINILRNAVSYIYDTYSKDNPSITYSSDGTGTGKSYSVINQFIQQTDVNAIANGHRNLLFITPQKAQIDIDSKLIETANNKGIRILSFLARNDMSNIEFKSWVTEELNKDVFNRWVKKLNNDNQLKVHIQKLDKAVRDAQFYNLEIPKSEQRGEFDVVEEYEERKDKNENKLQATLLKLAETILQQNKNGEFIAIKEKFSAATYDKDGKPKNKAGILAEIIDFVLPFERAKLSPCILLATSDKFDYKVNIAVNNKDGKPSLKSLPFDYIIGQKKEPEGTDEEARTADVNGKPFAEQIDFIKHDYFIADDNNYFRKHNISFTLIVDEEHVAYDKFFARSHEKLFDANTQIAHVFSVVNRIVQSFESVTEDNSEDFVLYEAHDKFVSELNNLFKTKCDISKGVTLNQILGIFSNNLNHIVIDSSELEQIIHICKNVFSITPKRFFNETGLKKIRIASHANNTGCRIYFERDKIDTNPTMHDILQALMCVFAACSHINDSDFRSMILHGAENSQNALLDKFVRRAISARANVDAMFDRVDNENLYIDEFFTYFTPKVVFSIEKVNDLSFRSPQLKNKVYVTFRLDLFEALPEVTLMRVLHNTKNSIVCLSATSGFKNSYSGNYCRPVMQKYGSDTRDNLDYCSIYRTNDDAEKLQQLRESREEARNVSIKEFVNTEKNQITDAHNEKDFLARYSFWWNNLRKHFKKDDNQYRIDGFKRQIEAMLLAAYDKKNTLILSLSNQFGRVLRDFLQFETGKLVKGLKVIDEDNQKIFEIKPFDNGITLRVILFDAQLAKDLNIEEYLKLHNTNIKIAFISAYKSAGTGLNLFTHYENEGIDEDFERLVLVNGPFYSNILTQSGLNSIENYVLLLKHYADESKSYQLKDFDVNLVNGNNYKILMQEHSMSILKDIMQAIGRIERRDTYMDTEIFLPSDTIDDMALQLSRLKREGNDLVFQSISLLNHKLTEYCLNKVREHSFKSDDEREQFSSTVAETGQAIDSFFKEHLKGKRLNEARQGDQSAVALNEALRSYDCIIEPQKYVEKLLALPEIKTDPFFQYVISNFYLHLEGNLKGITLCTKDSDRKILTDLADGDKIYQPYNWILPNYHKSIRHECSTSTNVLHSIFRLKKELSKEYLPHPEMLPLFKGNIGEYMFAECLKLMNLKPLTVNEIFTQLEPIIYELFDFYILTGNKVFCIDVKNWSASFDKEQLSFETHDKALIKRETLVEVTREKGLSAEFIYVNTHQDRNAINYKQEFGEEAAIHYLNLFKVITQYENVNSDNPKRKSTLRDRLNINSSLIHILGGSLNG